MSGPVVGPREALGWSRSPAVTLVVPGRNASRTLEKCLTAATRRLTAGDLEEILYVDDGSEDDSPEIAAGAGVRCLQAGGLGPGGARNVGWRAATGELVWFIDADCVVAEDTLRLLLETLKDDRVGGVGGSYANAVPGSHLARLIHAEIRERHLAMGAEVDYLGSFNVVYRRSVLDEVGGFDEDWMNGPGAPGGEDADLSYRVSDAGYRLQLRADARVAHHHPVQLWSYLRAQRLHGFWGVRLYRRHPSRRRRNSYSGLLDHLQPPLATLSVGTAPLAAFGAISAGLPSVFAAGLLLSTLPMTYRLMRRRGGEMAWFAVLAMIRALARGVGLTWGVLDMLTPGQWRPRR